MKICNASCFSAGVPGKSVRFISAGRSCLLWGLQVFQAPSSQEGFLFSAPRGQDTITSLLHTSNSSWYPLVTFASPCTIARRVRSFNHTTFGEGFTTWTRKQVLEPLTIVFATWMFSGTGTLRGSTSALGPQAGPVIATLATEFGGTSTGYLPATHTKPEVQVSEVLG